MLKMGYFLEKTCKNRGSVGGFILLLQLQRLKAFVGRTQKYFAPRLRGALATPLVI